MNDVPYLVDAAVVRGRAARAIGPHLRRAFDIGTFSSLPPTHRAEVDAAITAIEMAGRQSVLRERVAVGGIPSETPVSRSGGHSADEVLSVKEAARVLRVSVRRVCQIAPALGRQVDGRWMLDRQLVEEEAARRGHE